MPVIEYVGERGLSDRFTRVIVECPLCGRRRNTNARTLSQSSDVCQGCATRGAPVTAESAKKLFPCIVDILTFGKRGGVTTESRVIAKCGNCNRNFETWYKGLRENWTCKHCSSMLASSTTQPLFPENLPDFISGYRHETLAPNGTVSSKTVVFVECPGCHREIEREWAYAKQQTHHKCLNCGHAAMWESENYRRKIAQAQKTNGHLSKLHCAIRDEITRLNIGNFQSEYYIGSRIRVDEVDLDTKVVLEVYGDWWHFNPRIYPPDKATFRNEKRITATDVWKHDSARINKIESLGYAVYIIWEMDFRADPERSIQEFAEWLDDLYDLASIKMGPLSTTA